MKPWIVPALALCSLVALPLNAQDKPKPADKPAEKPVDKPQDKPAAKPADKPAEKPKNEAYKLGSTVDENLVVRDIDGKELKFKDLRDKVVMIHFWSATCPFEVAANPKFMALHERWKDKKDVVVLAINSNTSEIDTPGEGGKPDYKSIHEHLKKEKLTFPVYVDHGNKLADLFQATNTPHCFVLNKKGVIVYAGGLDDDPKGEKGEATKQYVRDAVEQTLEGKEVTVKESKPYGCTIKRMKAGA
jgi:thiol-disulfide isomerase/thioredoxin